ncbi:MAG: hypothetical protein E7656_08560 [Ruminococcaceae bacterium]|nr:hypothetical protein [Oscillospiraceae bacterium]
MKDLIDYGKKSPIAEEFEKFGFRRDGDDLVFKTLIASGQLKLVITFRKGTELFCQIFDTDFGDEYILHKIPDAEGAFVGQVREEYEKIISDLLEKCFDGQKKFCGQLLEIREYLLEKYGDTLEFPWDDENAIVRRADNKKWYAAFLSVGVKKIGLPVDRPVKIMNVKADPKKIESAIDGKCFFPAYHMNKKHWITLLLDDGIDISEIKRWIDESFFLVEK